MNENDAVVGQDAPKPPLPPRPRITNRNKKQREREVPNVDWEHSLQHFAVVVSNDLNDVHTRFLHENIVTFATWKRLWRDARMSAAFLVEFWESTATNTHKTILQQTLDGLVSCIEEHDGKFEDKTDVASLIGRVFAMFCAYSVQLGSPKHKIDVNPHAWTALLTIDMVMSGVGAKLYPTAAREVRAMMHHLVVKENAFLCCLEGFGLRTGVTKRVVRSTAVACQDVALVPDNATELNTPIDQNNVKRLETLNDRYQELMARARAGTPAFGAALRAGSRLDRPAVSAPLLSSSMPQVNSNDGQDLTSALTKYLAYKANEEVRRHDRAARAAAARENESQNVLEMRNDSDNILDTHGSVTSGSFGTEAVVSNHDGSHLRRNSEDSETALNELESDLFADISNDHVVGPSGPESARQLARRSSDKFPTAYSESSEAESDALADLERELEQSVDVESSQTLKHGDPEKTSTCAPHRKRDRHPSTAGIVSRKTLLRVASAVKPARIESAPSTAKRAKNALVTSRPSLADSRAISSSADSEDLVTTQAELGTISALSGPQRDSHSAQRIMSKSKASSVVSDGSELIAQLQAELDLSAGPTSSNCTSAAIVQAERRMSSRLSSVASEADSNALDELEKELIATGAALGAAPPSSMPAPAKKTPRKRSAAAPKRPAKRTRTTQSNAKKTRVDEVTTSVVRPLPATQTRSKAQDKQKEAILDPIAHQETSRIDSMSSDTESDGLAELIAELKTTTKIETSTRTHRQRNRSSQRIKTLSPSRNNLPASSSAGASRSDTVLPSSVALPNATNPRRSARLSSLASDQGSDGLEDLMTELACNPALTPLVVNTKKPMGSTRKLPVRAPKRKARQSQAKEGPKVAQPTRQRVSQMAPSTLQLPIARRNVSSSRRSTRSSSIAIDSESDGLAELEAELQAGHT